MASFCGNFNRPLSAMAAVAVAGMSTDIPDRFNPIKTLDRNVSTSDKSAPVPVPIPNSEPNANVTHISLPFVSNFKNQYKTDLGFGSYTSFSDSLIAPYQYAKLGNTCMNREISKPKFPDSDVLYRWHLPDPNSCSDVKSKTVVVLLGWLGARQRHLRRYADWYTSRGYHVVTFTLPMSDIVNYKAADMTEENMGLLAKHLMDCLDEEDGKHFVFHTFSNTGWLIYAGILERFKEEDASVMEKIKGCIVNLAPVDFPDPREPNVDMVVTDYYMPGMSGYELLKEIKSSPRLKEIPVLIMSSENSSNNIHRCLEEGARDFLVKPVGIPDIPRLTCVLNSLQ